MLVIKKKVSMNDQDTITKSVIIGLQLCVVNETQRKELGREKREKNTLLCFIEETRKYQGSAEQNEFFISKA